MDMSHREFTTSFTLRKEDVALHLLSSQNLDVGTQVVIPTILNPTASPWIYRIRSKALTSPVVITLHAGDDIDAMLALRPLTPDETGWLVDIDCAALTPDIENMQFDERWSWIDRKSPDIVHHISVTVKPEDEGSKTNSTMTAAKFLAIYAHDTDACFKLAMHYEEKKYGELALKWCQKGSQMGHQHCQFHMALWYETGTSFLEANMEEAVIWCAKAGVGADQDIMRRARAKLLSDPWFTVVSELSRQAYAISDLDSVAMQRAKYGHTYTDIPVLLYELIAERTTTGEGEYMLARAYLDGRTAEASLPKAVVYLEKAAEKGNAYAMAKLAEFYMPDDVNIPNISEDEYNLRKIDLVQATFWVGKS